ncbi:MAG: hypothetical protein ACLFWL_00125 [Candidatus Brocadiia bacterium]
MLWGPNEGNILRTFKVISELESGKLSSMAEARRNYGIGGGSTVANWLKKYGKNHLLGKVVKVETLEDILWEVSRS